MREVELYRMTPDEEWEYAGLATWGDSGLEPVVGDWPVGIVTQARGYFVRDPSTTHWEGSIGRERFRAVFRPAKGTADVWSVEGGELVAIDLKRG